MTASSAPTGTVSSSPTSSLVTLPATGLGISVSTLSVETSSSGSSTSTVSPSFLSHRVTVPSVTDSPSAGIVTVVPPSSLVSAPACSAPACSAPACSVCGCRGSCGPADPELAASGSDVAASGSCSLDGSATSCVGCSVACWVACCVPSSEAVAPALVPSPITARSAPTGTVSSSPTSTSCSVPATGLGISVSTLSVDTSSSGSSTSTCSPTCLSQRVTVPSVTDSPSAGIFTRSDIGCVLLRRHAGHWCRSVVLIRRGRAAAFRRAPGAPRRAPRSVSGARGSTARPPRGRPPS